MRRRDFFTSTAAAGAGLAALSGSHLLAQGHRSILDRASASPSQSSKRLVAPADGRIPVAFVISRGATVIDFAGPWEVFQDVMIGKPSDPSHRMPFQLFMVSDKTEPIRASAGLRIIPDYTFETAPDPKVVVIPAQAGGMQAMYDWLRKVSQSADVTMSVCTGAFHLARAGLLDGKAATTHHDFIDRLEKEFPKVSVKRGLRFVEGDKISTAGGLTSGIDLALRVVERYFGREVAQATATYMEYQSKGWMQA